MHDIIDFCTTQLFYLQNYLKRHYDKKSNIHYIVSQKSPESVWSA